MADLFTKLTQNIAYVQQLGDNPNSDNGLTAAALKAWFDKAPLEIQTYLNNTFIPQIEAKFGSIDAWIEQANGKMNSFVAGTGFVPCDGSVPMNGNLMMGNKKIVNLGTPEQKNDAVNKEYADTIKTMANEAKTAAADAKESADQKCSRKSMTVTLTMNNWAGGYQMVAAEGVKADSSKCDVFVSPTEESREIYADFGIRCTGQSENKLTFMCNTTPEQDLQISVVILT